jgi:hypothetical protein
MFDRRKLSLEGARAQALVVEKTIYAAGVESGEASACRYRLRVAFPDGATSEISSRAFGRTLAAAGVGDIIPVRYDPTDRSRIELDRRALVEQEEARAREAVAERLARGEQALGLSSTTNAVTSVGEPLEPDTGGLRIGDADRHLIAEVLSQHMVDGRLTIDELEDRLGTLYASQTRAQARSALASLPTLAPSGGEDHAALVLPDWASGHEAGGARSPGSMLPRPSGVGAAPVPTDGEMNTAYRRWRAKAEKTKAAQAAHQQAEASGDPREPALAFKLKVSRGEEKTARAKLDQLRTRRPDWTTGDR